MLPGTLESHLRYYKHPAKLKGTQRTLLSNLAKQSGRGHC